MVRQLPTPRRAGLPELVGPASADRQQLLGLGRQWQAQPAGIEHVVGVGVVDDRGIERDNTGGMQRDHDLHRQRRRCIGQRRTAPYGRRSRSTAVRTVVRSRGRRGDVPRCPERRTTRRSTRRSSREADRCRARRAARDARSAASTPVVGVAQRSPPVGEDGMPPSLTISRLVCRSVRWASTRWPSSRFPAVTSAPYPSEPLRPIEVVAQIRLLRSWRRTTV